MRLAIIGMGWAGQRQAQALGELDGEIELACCVEADPAQLARVTSALGIAEGHTDLAAVLTDGTIDAVSICTPHGLHAPMAIAAAQAGKHVLVEKPMALTVADATAMIDAARLADVRLYVAESATYQPLAGFLREVIQSGRHIGDLVAATVVGGFRAPEYGYPARRAWLGQLELGGTGTWMLHGIHTVAQLRYVFGEVATVYAQASRTASFRRNDIEATMSLQLTLTSGATVHLIQTAEVKLAGDLGGYTVFGDRGSLRATSMACCFTEDDGGQQCVEFSKPERSEYAQELAAFAAWVRDGKAGPTTGLSERRSLAIVQAGYESAAQGGPVDLASRFGPL